MKIALLGSWKKEYQDSLDYRLSFEPDFAAACALIGGDVTKRGHTLLVCSETPATADYNAVKGALEALGTIQTTKPAIRVIRKDDGKHLFGSWRVLHPHLFSSFPSPDATWEVTHVVIAQQCDVMLVIGGGRKSYATGLTAALLGRPVVPIGSFGGAGRRLLKLFLSSSELGRSTIASQSQLLALNEPWSKIVHEQIISLVTKREQPRLMIIHGRSEDRNVLKELLENGLGLPEPIIMGSQFTPGGILPEKFEMLASRVDGAIALATPDDFGRLAGSRKLVPRARQNIWLEVGWFWGRLGRKRLLVMCKGKPEIPSDLAGVEYLQYTDSPNEAMEGISSFASFLRNAE